MSRVFRATVVAVALVAIAVVVVSHHRKSQGARVSVLVAARLIPKGTPLTIAGTEAKVVSIPKAQAAPGFFGGAPLDPTALAGRVALRNIARGEQLTASEFGR